MLDIEKITWRTKLSFIILLWVAEKLYDGTYPHQIMKLVEEIKERLKKEDRSE